MRMRRARFNSLFWRLLLAVGSVLVATLLVSSLIYATLLRSVIQEQNAEALAQDAEQIAIWASPFIDSQETLHRVLGPDFPWVDRVTVDRLWLVNRDGQVVADSSSGNSFVGTRLADPWVEKVLSGSELQENRPNPWNEATITVGHPVMRGGQVVGAAFLFLGATHYARDMANFRLVIGLTVAAVGLLGLFLALGLSRSFSRPIEAMSGFAANLGELRFPNTLKPSGIDELDHLGRALVEAAQQLQSGFEAVVEEKQRIQSLIQDMAEGVVAVDEANRLLLANPAAERMLGLALGQSGPTPTEVGLPEPLSDGLTRGAAPQQPEHSVIQFTCNGAELRAMVSPVISPGGRLGGAVALLQDVTMEAQLQKLRQNFVANVSHELRGPLSALSAGVEAMHDGVIPEESRPRYLKAMLSEIERLRRLVNDLLELTRLDSGVLKILREEFDIRPLLEGIEEKWLPRVESLGVTLKVESPDLRVMANYDRIEEILTNFLDNALRFTEAGGVIRVWAKSEGAMVRVGVTDTGVGIGKEHLAHIWDRFYKVDPARTRTKGSGTGMGLAIVKQLVEILGGEVDVQSEPGKGSTFSFTVPTSIS
ncbi:MAG: ATP-binding protein [Mycobacterium leprae]